MYEIIKTINGIGYRYQQETYRENWRVKTRSVYIGPVDGGRRKRGKLTEFVRELVKKKDRREDIGESDAEASARVAREDAQRAKDARVNDLLTAPSISLEGIAEVAEKQSEPTADVSSSESSQPSGQSDGDPGGTGGGDGPS